MKHPYRHAFTLIELLVVLAVIAIIAAILLPAIGRVRVVSMNAKDAQHMRQAGAALLLYANDHDGYFPAVSSGYNSFSATLLEGGYVEKGSLAFSSPFDPNVDRVLQSGRTPRSYVMVEPAMTPGYKQYSQPRSVQSFNHPSRVGMLTIWLRDASASIDEISVEGRYGGAVEYQVGTDGAAIRSSGRADGGRNIVFIDGHVEFLTPEQLRPAGNYVWGTQVGSN